MLCPNCGTDSTQALTARELSVAGLVAEGMSNHDVAATLFLADKTAKNLVSAVIQKLGVSNRTQIAAWYLRPKRKRDGQVPDGTLRYSLADVRAAYTAGWRRGAETGGPAGGQYPAPGGLREAGDGEAGHRGGRAGLGEGRHGGRPGDTGSAPPRAA
jgi:DNA-binding CsgD family transcriptional regulator